MKRKVLRIRRVVFIVVGIVFSLNQGVRGAELFTHDKEKEEKISYEKFDPLTWLFSDSKPGENPTKVAILLAPCGSGSGFQVLLDGVPEGTEVYFASEGLVNTEGHLLRDISGNLLHSVPVEYNTGEIGFTTRKHSPVAEGISRKAPFRCFDVIEPIKKGTHTWKDDAAAFYVGIDIPGSALPGKYSGKVRIMAGDISITIPVELEVAAVRLPSEIGLSQTIWYDINNMASFHDLEIWSSGHWRMIQKYSEMMFSHHQNMFRADLRLVYKKKDANNNWTFDFSRLERLMHIMIDAGMTRIEGGHIGSCKKWGESEIYVWPSVELWEQEVRISSEEAQDFLAQFLPEWRLFLENHGWYGMLCQHVSDEPTHGAFCDYLAGACAVRKYLPGVPIIDAVEFSDLGSAVDWWVIKPEQYEGDFNAYDKPRSNGDQIWCYTCCKPGGPYMNRLLDFPLLRVRLLAWGCAKYNMPGYLHWALNSWHPVKDPFKHSIKPDDSNDIPVGDRYIVYPGTDGPWSSMRYEAQREGWEDYALLMMARKQLNTEQFDTLMSKTVRGFSEFTDDPAVFRRQYRELLMLVSAKEGRSGGN